jgi:hypothetical protein
MPNQQQRDDSVRLLNTIDPSDRILLYPSSCRYFREIEDMDFDSVLLVSNSFARSYRAGKTICLKEDNNFVIGHLLGRGIELDALCVIRDGCEQGGNYECILSPHSIGRMLPILRACATISKDHHGISEHLPWTLKKIPVPDHPKQFAKHSSPINELSSFQVSKRERSERISRMGCLEVVVSHQSIWENLRSHDLLFMAPFASSHEGYHHFLDGLASAGIETSNIKVNSVRPVLSIAALLDQAEERECERICLGPIADGNYGQILEEISRHQGKYLREIKFCHLDADDLKSIS